MNSQNSFASMWFSIYSIINPCSQPTEFLLRCSHWVKHCTSIGERNIKGAAFIYADSVIMMKLVKFHVIGRLRNIYVNYSHIYQAYEHRQVYYDLNPSFYMGGNPGPTDINFFQKILYSVFLSLNNNSFLIPWVIFFLYVNISDYISVL